jgi:hypothetical protein
MSRSDRNAERAASGLTNLSSRGRGTSVPGRQGSPRSGPNRSSGSEQRGPPREGTNGPPGSGTRGSPQAGSNGPSGSVQGPAAGAGPLRRQVKQQYGAGFRGGTATRAPAPFGDEDALNFLHLEDPYCMRTQHGGVPWSFIRRLGTIGGS